MTAEESTASFEHDTRAQLQHIETLLARLCAELEDRRTNTRDKRKRKMGELAQRVSAWATRKAVDELIKDSNSKKCRLHGKRRGFIR